MGERPGETEERACGRCGAPHAPEPGTAGLCVACRDEEFPPIGERGARWSPLALGALSLLCDPLLIPTVIAIKRGFEELGEVRRREQRGYCGAEHESIRTGAVFGILLAASRPLVFAALFFVTTLSALFAHGEAPGLSGPSEAEEILARLNGPDAEARALARRHLDALGPHLTREEAERALRAAEALGDGDGGDEARRTRTALVRAAIAAGPVEGPTGRVVTLERLRPLYPRLSREGREAVLAWVADREHPAAAELFLELVRREAAAAEPPALPRAALRRPSPLAARAVPALFAFEPPHPYRRAAVGLAAALCRADADLSRLGSARGALQAEWEARRRALAGFSPPRAPWARLEPARTREARAAAEVLTALSCAPDRDVVEVLRAAMDHDDPRVAAAAAGGLLRRGVEPSERRIRRLVRDPLSRRAVVAALAAHADATRVPRSAREVEALSESDLVPWLEARGLVPLAVERLATTRRRFFRDHLVQEEWVVHRVRTAEGAEHVALGPYPPSAWAMGRGHRVAVSRWRPEDGPWTEGSVDTLVTRARRRHDRGLDTRIGDAGTGVTPRTADTTATLDGGNLDRGGRP